MIKSRTVCFILLVLFITSCANNQRGRFKAKDIKNNKCIVIQEDEDIAPYAGKLIELEGYISYRFEEGAIYGSLRDLKKINYKNALWLCPIVPEKDTIGGYGENNRYIDDITGKRNKKQVVLSGYIDTSVHGHNGYYKGCFSYFNIRDGKIKDCP